MNKKNIASGFFITGFERIFTQGAQILLSIIIARLVSPSDYGILGIIMVLVHISTVFIDNGLGSALIYKHNLNQNDINTVFTFNVCLSSLFYIIIFLLHHLSPLFRNSVTQYLFKSMFYYYIYRFFIYRLNSYFKSTG